MRARHPLRNALWTRRFQGFSDAPRLSVVLPELSTDTKMEDPLEIVRREPCTFVVTVQSRGNEADSKPLRLQISWDGEWHDGAREMQRHLSVKVVPHA